jgi:L-aspartate oxidase
MEFVQFHPTALAAKNAPPFLLSEALRGEGGLLRNALLERFMPHYNEAAELAPRDVVSRAIVSELKRTRSPHVYLDLTGLKEEFVKKRFPRIYATCLNYGIDITTDMIPVRPAAHYAMGGLKTDLHGRTTLASLYAAGEVASTGVHGANRLASNSLLEGLVFGARAGKAMMQDAPAPQGTKAQSGSHAAKTPAKQKHSHGAAYSMPGPAAAAAPKALPEEGAEPALDKIRQLLGSHVEILRDGRELTKVIQRLEGMELPRPKTPERREWEIYNMWALARVVARCALARQESRGSHYRADFPYRDDECFNKHSLISCGGPVRFE